MITRSTHLLFAMFAIIGIASQQALAVTTAKLYPIGGGSPATMTFAVGADVDLTVGNNISHVHIYAASANDNIGNIFIDGSSTNDVWVYLASSSAPLTPGTSYYSTSQAACNNLAGFQDGRGHLQFRGAIKGNLTSQFLINGTGSGLWAFSTQGVIQQRIVREP